MKHSLKREAAVLIAAVTLGTTALRAQQPADSAARRQQRTIDSLAAVIRALGQRVDSIGRLRGADSAKPAPGGDDLAALRAAASAAADSTQASAQAQPQQARLGQNALNPEISATADLRTSVNSPGPQSDNFTAREFELALQSALDPFTVGKMFASFEGGEVSIEEGYLYFPALPGHLRLDIGRFRQQVGELNRWHLHAVPEDEYPLVIRTLGGPDGMVADGVSLYWPVPWSGRLGTYELYLQGTRGDNPVVYAGGRQPAVSGQLQGFWQFSPATILMASVTGAHGTNQSAPLPADTSIRTAMTSDLVVFAGRFSWRPPQQGTSRELTVRGEAWNLRRRYDGAGPWISGWYADATWRLGRRFIAGVRYDAVKNPDLTADQHQTAVTPSLTYWQSEFVFLRALWEHARDYTGVSRDRLTIQAVYAMGPHKHELF